MNELTPIVVPTPGPGWNRASPPARGALLRIVLDRMAQGAVVIDRRLRVLHCNRAAAEMLGAAADVSTADLTLPHLLHVAARLARDAAAQVLDACSEVSDPPRSAVRIALESQSPILVSVSRLSARHSVVLLTKAEGEAEPNAEAALIDPLTGLGNRRMFQQRAERMLAARRDPTLLLLDLDRFKAINDSLGHPVGDAVLCMVAHRLKSELRDDDVVTRLGGDEFAVLLPDGTGADKIAARLADLLGRAYFVQGHLAQLGASIGLAAAPADGETADRLMRSADLALYQAKEAGRGTWRRFDPDMERRAQERRSLEFDLRKALVLRELELHYQPQTSAESGKLLGFESLVRWRSPTRGLVSPALFIPLAEEIGLINGIGEWVLRTACKEALSWDDQIGVAVNVSPHQLDGSCRFINVVKNALQASGLPPRRLELEITESALLRTGTDVVGLLHELRALGVRISMDDFGTGYSSLSQLRSFPFDKIKIDRSFVQDLATDAESAAVVRAIAALGTSLGMPTTAEGVETQEQAVLIRDCGCSTIQGYLVSKPVPADRLPELIEAIARTSHATMSSKEPHR